jgi:NAD(P)H-flavin reductase
VTTRVQAPPGRRACEISASRPSGSYTVFSAIDEAGPMPQAGQFYMLAAAKGWGGDSGRPYLPRAFSVAHAEESDRGVRLEFLAEAVGPGTERLVGLGG